VFGDNNDDSTSDLHGSYVYICVTNSKYDRGLNFYGMIITANKGHKQLLLLVSVPGEFLLF